MDIPWLMRYSKVINMKDTPMLPVIEAFKAKYRLKDLVVVADAGLLSDDNIIELKSNNYEYILGARPKNEKRSLQSQILALKLENGQCEELEIDTETRLIISFPRQEQRKINRIGKEV